MTMKPNIEQYPLLQEVQKEFLALWPKIEEARKHDNRALLVDLIQPFIKKVNVYLTTLDNTEEEELVYKQVIRKLKTYLINSAWGKGRPQVDQQKSLDNIDYLMQEIVGGDSNVKAGGVFHQNPSNERSVAMRDVNTNSDQKKYAPSAQNSLDIPFDLCNNSDGAGLVEESNTPPVDSKAPSPAPLQEDGPFSIEDFMPKNLAIENPVEPESTEPITLIQALEEMIRIAEET